MSIVNQMLSDLQQRQESVKQLPLQAIRYKSFKFRYLSIFSIILLLVFLFWFSQKNEMLGVNGISELANETLKPTNVPQLNIASDNSESLIQESKENSKKETDLTEQIAVQTVSSSSLDKVEKKDDLLVVKKLAPLTEKNKNTHSETIIEPTQVKKQSIATTETKIKKQSNETIRNNQLEEIKTNFSLLGYQATKTALNDLLLSNPDFHAARLYLVLLSWQQNAIDTPQIISNSINLYPNQSAFRLTAARFYLEKQDYQEAENSLLNIQPTSDNLSELLQMRAVIRQKNNKHQLAVEDYTSILRLSPDRGDIYIALGISLEALNENNQALQSFKKAELDQRLSKRQLQFVKNKILFYSQQSQG